MKFKRVPKIKTADEFISSAGTVVPAEPAAAAVAAGGTASTPAGTRYPWEGKRSDKQTELFNLRLTEVELEKLRFIATNTPDSMQAFVRKAVLGALEAKLAELIQQ